MLCSEIGSLISQNNPRWKDLSGSSSPTRRAWVQLRRCGSFPALPVGDVIPAEPKRLAPAFISRPGSLRIDSVASGRLSCLLGPPQFQPAL